MHLLHSNRFVSKSMPFPFSFWLLQTEKKLSEELKKGPGQAEYWCLDCSYDRTRMQKSTTPRNMTGKLENSYNEDGILRTIPQNREGSR